VCALRLRQFPGRGKPAYGTSCHANANRTGEPVAVRAGERHLLQPGEPRQRSGSPPAYRWLAMARLYTTELSLLIYGDSGATAKRE
jgi:hypothetical protein